MLMPLLKVAIANHHIYQLRFVLPMLHICSPLISGYAVAIVNHILLHVLLFTPLVLSLFWFIFYYYFRTIKALCGLYMRASSLEFMTRGLKRQQKSKA